MFMAVVFIVLRFECLCVLRACDRVVSLQSRLSFFRIGFVQFVESFVRIFDVIIICRQGRWRSTLFSRFYIL